MCSGGRRMKLLDRLDDFVLKQYAKVSNEMYTRFGKDKYDLAKSSATVTAAGLAGVGTTYAGYELVKGDFSIWGGVGLGVCGLLAYGWNKYGKSHAEKIKLQEEKGIKHNPRPSFTDLTFVPLTIAMFGTAIYNATSGSPEVAKELPENLQSAGNALYSGFFTSLAVAFAGSTSHGFFLKVKQPEEKSEVIK